MHLTNRDIVELTALRRELHRFPDLSGDEAATAGRVRAAVARFRPDQVVDGLGGHGLAAIFSGPEPGPTVMFRAELDALPIDEISKIAHRSAVPGKGHLCGHDGHSAILIGLGRLISRNRPRKGRVVLLFQPAEEDGSGAAAVISDPRFGQISPDWAFALHNMPGIPLGHVRVAAGPANCASMGLKIVLGGKTSHASVPEAGLSPAAAMVGLLPALTAVGPGGALVPGYRLVTVTHARLGEPAFGIAPGHGEIWVTLRCLADADMDGLEREAIGLAEAAAKRVGLTLKITRHDHFAACHNDPAATAVIRAALDAEGISATAWDAPMRASEDFGRFGAQARSAMFLLGSGADHPMLHNPDFDFPDDLIAPGVRVFDRILRDLLG